MTDTPKPATALSAEDAEFFDWAVIQHGSGHKLVALVRDLDAKLVAARETIDGYDANQNRLVAENAALTERLRVAEEHAAAIEDRINALKPFVVHENGAHKVLLHNFDVMVAFFGDKDQPHRWDDLTAALAPTSDAAIADAGKGTL